MEVLTWVVLFVLNLVFGILNIKVKNKKTGIANLIMAFISVCFIVFHLHDKN